MVIGQNPGWSELQAGTPFIGPAGANLDEALKRYGHCRDEFYICNTVRCWTQDNQPPTRNCVKACEPYLRMEIATLRPKLLVALGAVAFERLCPNLRFSDCVGHAVDSQYDVKTYVCYHPSPLNLSDQQRRAVFNNGIKLLCGFLDYLHV
jgi:DNA polymerase